MAKNLTTKARVNHGRWLADCPACNGAELVALGRRFVCQAPGCGAQADVRWPAAPTKAKIEALLALRPGAAQRNWTPSETVKSLAAENRAHGISDKEA